MTENRYKQAKKVFPISLGARCREFESPISGQDVLRKDAAQKTPHESAVFSYIYRHFSIQKVRKNRFFSDNEFLAATGDILEMQPVVFMNWCDSNARA